MQKIPVEYFGDTSVTDSELSRDDARPDTSRSHLDNLESDVIGKRSPIDEDTSQLVYPSLTCRLKTWITYTARV